jgi:hypothetical protein
MRSFFAGLILCATALALAQESAAPPAAPPAATQPGGTLRKPEQAEILQSLLRERDQAKPILPSRPTAPGAQNATREIMPGTRQLPSGLLSEGSFISERPGRFIRESGRPVFVFSLPGSTATQAIEVLPNQFLEALEREALTGGTEFIVTAEVTVYSGRNYLLIRKILRRVDHGNLGP